MPSSATTRIPVEIWSRILSLSISVPIFLDSGSIEPLDVDGGTIHQCHWELPYWSSERHRNAFRRVCKSWNEYLRPFDHRYIRLSDIVHEVVPMSAFPHAIRLYIGLCMCIECAKIPSNDIWMHDAPRTRPWMNGDSWKARYLKEGMHCERLEFLESLLTQYGGQSKLEILHAGRGMTLEVDLACSTIALRGVIGLQYDSLLRMQDSDILRSLQVYIEHPGRMDRLHTKRIPPMCLRSLTTLNIGVQLFESFQEMDLPALKHLSVRIVGRNSFRTVEPLMLMLDTLGPQLETFYFTSPLNEETTPPGIWTVLPNVVELQTPYKWRDPPPVGHPLRRVTITFEGTVDYGRGKTSIDDFTQYFPITEDGRFDKKGVVISHHWSQLLFHRIYDGPSITVLWQAMRAADDVGIELVDLNGLHLEEYILSFLVNIWKRTMIPRKFRLLDLDSVYL